MQGKVYIVVLNYNGWKDTIECLESLIHNSYDCYQILVIDNNSSDNSKEKIRLWAKGERDTKGFLNKKNLNAELSFRKKPISFTEIKFDDIEKRKETEADSKIIFISLMENRGFSGGNNVGIYYATTKDDFEYLWFLNNDTVVEKNALKEMVEFYREKRGRIGLLGSVICYYDKPNVVQGFGGLLNKITLATSPAGKGVHLSKIDTHIEIDSVVGPSFLISRAFVEDIGFFSEDYFLYYEEMDISIKAKEKGWRYVCVPSSLVYHKGGKSSNIDGSFVPIYHLTRSRIIFAKKYFQKSCFIVYFLSLLKYLMCMILFKFRKGNAILNGLKEGFNWKPSK